MSARKYQVAVIIINYNSSQYTLDCINSVFEKTTDVAFQIVVVDNNSREEEFAKLEVLSDARIKVIRNRINTGFSGANMSGAMAADADTYYFLNNDTVLLNDCLKILCNFLEATPVAANCSGEMMNAKGEYEYNFRYFPTLQLKLFGSSLLRIFSPESFPHKRTRYTNSFPVDLVNGSSMFVRASAFEAIGGFDTNYFLYCEEEDLALRLKRAGHLTYFVPEARYQHFEHKSSASDNSIRLPYLKEFYISFLYYYSKNYNFFYRKAIQFLYFFKLIRKFYKNSGYFYLAFFIAAGAPVKHSLRFKQKMNSK